MLGAAESILHELDGSTLDFAKGADDEKDEPSPIPETHPGRHGRVLCGLVVVRPARAERAGGE